MACSCSVSGRVASLARCRNLLTLRRQQLALESLLRDRQKPPGEQ